jgi:hypothetical protein
MNALRSVVAVGAGFFTTTVSALAGDYALRSWMRAEFEPDGSVSGSTVLVITLIYASIFGAVGAYIAAWIGQVRPMLHAGIVGTVMLVSTALATIMTWGTAPPWYHIATLALVLPVALIGGKVREMQSKHS